MKGELMISSLSIDMEEETGRKYLYAGLFDFYADTEKGLKKLTDTMYDNGLFSFCNDGAYIGLDDKKNMHWTLDDGEVSIDWLLKVAEVVKNMNDNGDRVVISISKSFLLYHEAVEDFTIEYGKKVRGKERIIDIYTYYLRKVLEENGYGDLLETGVQGKLYKNTPSKLESGKLYIS